MPGETKGLVITATRGESPWLAQTVASVGGLGLEALHVLVCPESVVNRLSEQFPMVTVLSERCAGLYGALNSAKNLAKDFEWVTWINDDDKLHFSTVLAAVKILIEKRTAQIVYGRVEMINAEGRRMCEVPVARRPSDLKALMARGVMPLAQPGTVVRRSCLDQVGWFDESFRLAGDLDFFARAILAEQEFVFFDRVLAAFRLRSGQLSKEEDMAASEWRRAIGGIGRHFRGPTLPSRLRFIWDNHPTYRERLFTFGFQRMRSVYRHA